MRVAFVQGLFSFTFFLVLYPVEISVGLAFNGQMKTHVLFYFILYVYVFNYVGPRPIHTDCLISSKDTSELPGVGITIML